MTSRIFSTTAVGDFISAQSHPWVVVLLREAPAGRVSFVKLPGVAAFGATTGRGITTSPGLASGTYLVSLSLMVQKLHRTVAQRKDVKGASPTAGKEHG